MTSSRSYNDLSMAVDELVNACQQGNTTHVKALLDGGLSTRLGLRKALEKAILNNHAEIVKLLLGRGVLDHCILSSEDEWPWLLEPADTTRSLQFAAVNGKTEVVTALIEWDIRLVDCVDSLKRTALSFAARAGHIETVRVLIAAAADIKAVDVYGLTALDHARAAYNRDIVECLEAEIARVKA
ncbi:hypothetical protein ASPVEDRAFT_33023 [Aspergillus versicolor CBS 583.65]|uniref:Uncharacterized protein n=1 Tax=Aspergillus versicolor CBS 583.65 TaxID=1036611 RepID=A0A1L9PYZ5_ASPVE|nr:uncharacterized protein ASPVEDRAFT_33023 [Aspergillus versicolor CBS 583.65]OJJ06747.1 hypothetical protein ASPVEDRAFT_33023 [Aspergillus versicolor CBS 583.65]